MVEMSNLIDQFSKLHDSPSSSEEIFVDEVFFEGVRADLAAEGMAELAAANNTLELEM